MRLTVLGSSASYPGPGQACAGYLIEGGGSRVLFDLGNGTLSNLGRVTDALGIDAVFISHCHPDHYLDLFALQGLLRYAPQGPAPALPVYAPAGLLDRAAALLIGRGGDELRKAFQGHDLAACRPVRFGGLTVTPHPVDHEGPAYALVAEADGRRMCYTSDTRPGDPVAEAARGSHLLLAEATLPEAYAGRAPHMTAAEAGALAEASGAGTLVVTHLWPTTPREQVRAQASSAFRGEVFVAEELLAIDI